VELLTNFYDEPMTETKHKYDAFSTTTKYEIKSRCRYNTFLTTIIYIPVHKVRNVTERLVFVLHFTDGLYYTVYDKDLFETFEQLIKDRVIL
jgi:hypothetical protein